MRTLTLVAAPVTIYGAPGFFPPGTDERLREWYVAEIAKSDVEVLCGLYGLLRHANSKPFLPRIGAPVRGLYPTAGALTSSEQEALLKEGIKDFRVVHLPTSSHAVLTLEPETCARHVLRFVTEHD